MRIALVDDHTMFRQALRDYIARLDRDIAVVAEASTAREARALIDRLDLDLLVMDIVLDGMNGISATREIRRAKPRCEILILTGVESPTFVHDALAAGACGYALKDQPIQELLAAIHRTGSGRRYLAPALEHVAGLDGEGTVGRASDDLLHSLSTRERELFNLVVAGYSNQRIASELFISIKTVETHRSRINRKLKVHSTGDLVRFAALRGLLSA